MQIITWEYSIKSIFKDWLKKFFQLHFFGIRLRALRCIFKMLRCGTWWLWSFTFTCPNCWDTKQVHATCKCRLCPSCWKPLSDKWFANVVSWLPQNIKYYHITFTIPEQLRPFFRKHRSTLTFLFQAVHRTIAEFFQEEFNGKTGVITGIHTFWSDLKRNPHIHALVPVWYIKNDWSARISIQEDYLSYESIKDRRRYNLIKLLRTRGEKNLKYKYNRFYKLTQHLYTFSWYAKVIEVFSSFKDTISYIGRYIKKPIIAESRIKEANKNSVKIQYKQSKPFKILYRTFTIAKFIWFIILHLPDKNFRCIRYAWIFSHRTKKFYLELLSVIHPQKKQEQIEVASSYRERMIISFGKDPLVCTKCWTTMILSSVCFPNIRQEFNNKYISYYKYLNSS